MVFFSCFEGGADFFERADLAFDAARVDEHREPLHVWIPQFLIDFEERQFDRLPRVIAQVDMIVDVTALMGAQKWR